MKNYPYHILTENNNNTNLYLETYIEMISGVTIGGFGGALHTGASSVGGATPSPSKFAGREYPPSMKNSLERIRSMDLL